MPARLNPTVVARIEDALQEPGMCWNEEQIKHLADQYHTTPRTIRRHKARILNRRPVGKRTGGQIKVVTPEIDAAIEHIVAEMPWVYQEELNEMVREIFEIDVSVSTIQRALNRIEVTRKKLTIEASQRNEELRVAWMDSMQQFTAEQFVCLDESGSDRDSGDRKYGYSKKGTKAKVARWLASRERTSLLPAYTTDGVIASITFTGTCNADIFEDFVLETVLPLCNPYPAPRSVIVMDNASIHHAERERIEEICAARGVWVRYLPPYSPDLNPIELFFNDLKALIRRTYRRQRPEFPDYQEYIEWAVRECGTGAHASENAKKYFHKACMRG